ncbi:hypothetical protein Tco_1421008 [Tanacetum coccineum]
MDKSGPVPIRFEFGNRETLMPLGEHAAHWANYLGELVRELPLHHPSWRQVLPEEKAGVMARNGFDMRPHMESDRWPLIYAAIQQHLQKIYKGKKATLKEKHWIPDSDETYDLERIRKSRPSHISEMKSSATREYPSLIHTFFLTHTVNGVFLNPEDKVLYGLGSNTEMGVPYTEDEIMAIVHGGKQWGHIPGVGRSDDKFSHMLSQLESHPEIGGGSGSGGCGDDEQGYDEDDDEDGKDEDNSHGACQFSHRWIVSCIVLCVDITTDMKVSVKASGFGFGSFCKCKKTVECVACLLRQWNRSRGREVQIEIALDVAGEKVVGLGKGRDGNEHVQRMLHVICVINNKKGLKEDSRCDRGEGQVFGNGLEREREPWKRLGSRSSRLRG